MHFCVYSFGWLFQSELIGPKSVCVWGGAKHAFENSVGAIPPLIPMPPHRPDCGFLCTCVILSVSMCGLAFIHVWNGTQQCVALHKNSTHELN